MLMKILRISLLKALKAVKPTLTNNPIIPVIENVLIECDGASLTATSSNLRSSMSATIDVHCEDTRFLIPPVLINTLSKIKDDIIELSVNDSTITLITESGRYDFTTEGAIEFPIAPSVTDSKQIKVPQFVLKTALRTLMCSVSSDELKPSMNGVSFQNVNGLLNLTSTDTNKLNNFAIEGINIPEGMDIIVSTEGCKAIDSVLSASEEEVTLSFNDNILNVKVGSVSITSRLLDENFPCWQQIIPSTSEVSTIFDKDELIESLDRVSLLSNKITKLVKLSIHKGNCEISAQDIDFGNSGSTNIDCDSNGSIEIGFNAGHLSTLLKNTQGDKIALKMNNPNSAVVIKGTNTTFTGLIIPIMIRAYQS